MKLVKTLKMCLDNIRWGNNSGILHIRCDIISIILFIVTLLGNNKNHRMKKSEYTT